MKRPSVALLILTLTAVSVPIVAIASTPEERKWAVDTTRWLEEHPLAPEAKRKTALLLKWWLTVPDLMLHACPVLLEVKNERTGPPMADQAMLSAGAFQIEHPKAPPA